MVRLGYQVGLTPDTFYRTTLYDFNRMIEAYWQERQHEMDMIRRHASLIMSTQVARKDQSKIKPKNIWPLPMDEPDEVEFTEEELQERKRKFNERIERLRKTGVINGERSES